MGKWEMVRLGDYIKQIRGVSYKPEDTCGFENITYAPLLRAHNIQSDGLNIDNLVFVHKRKIKEYQYIKKDDIIVCASSGSKELVGKAAQATKDMTVSFGTFCKVIRSLSKVNPTFLNHYFSSQKYRHTISALSAGANIYNLRNEHINELIIPLPPLDEQKRIAKNLDLASELVKGYKEQLAELDKLVLSVFYQMFGDPVTNEKGWEVTRLSEVCKKITDGTHNSPENLETGEYRYITAKNIKRDGILLSNITYVSKQVHEEIYARCNPEMGDVLYIKDGVTTGIAVVNTLNEPFSMLSSVALLKLKNTICNKYLCNVLNCKEMYRKIRENMGGAAITRLTLVKIKNIEIPLPPLPLQIRFASIVTEIEAHKEQVKQALTEAENLFNSLMQEYFE